MILKGWCIWSYFRYCFWNILVKENSWKKRKWSLAIWHLTFNETFPGHRLETQIHIQTQIQLDMILTLATNHLMVINKNKLYIHLKAFYKNLVLSCCVTSFLGCCPVNLTFLALQCPLFSEMSTHGSQTSQITTNSY